MPENNYRLLYSTVLCLLLSAVCFSQTIIKGQLTAQDSALELYSASILLKKGDSILAYTYSNQQGNYRLTTTETGLLQLTYQSLGYQPKTKKVELKPGQEVLSLDIKLIHNSQQLQAVLIESDRPIEVREDTVVFAASYFTNGTEESVEDLLKKIPGLNIDDDGTITVGNQEIEKVMVEGGDFFGKGYKLLTKNMPAFPIENVQLLKNYSNNNLLKSIEDSEKVALNLTLKDNAKRVWFGTIKAGIGNGDYHSAKGNLMNFGKHNSYYLLGSMNTIGQDVFNDIRSIMYAQHFDEAGHIGDNEHAKRRIDISRYTPDIGASRTNFNNDKLLSFNAIFNPTERLKVKPILFFNWNSQRFYRRRREAVKAEGTEFVNNENYHLHHKSYTLFGKLDVHYNFSETQSLKAVTRYNSRDNTANAALIFNSQATKEALEAQNERFDQKIIYTNNYAPQKVFLLSGRLIHERLPERYRVNQFYYQQLFPALPQADNVGQYSRNTLFYLGFNGHLMRRGDNDNLFELQLGNEYRSDDLTTRFSIFDQQKLLNQPAGYQNQTTYRVNDLYLKGSYEFNFNAFSITGKLAIHQLINRLDNNNTPKEETPFFINPGIHLGWDINAKNTLSASYNLNTSTAEILDVYDSYILTSYRSFDKGTGQFQQLQASSASLFYQFGNWTDRFFVNATVLYVKNHDFLSTRSILQQDFIQSEKMLIKNREMLSVNSQLNYYFKALNSNLKVQLGYSQSDYKNIINDAALRTITSLTSTYGIELRSSFDGFFNFHIGTEWRRSQVKTGREIATTDNQSFLNLLFKFSESFDAAVQSSYYYFGNLEQDQTYAFLDLEVNYALIKNKLGLQLRGKNLFDTQEFNRYSISDISTSTTSYRLLPRMVLLSAKYRF